jgi:hypothetical protein
VALTEAQVDAQAAEWIAAGLLSTPEAADPATLPQATGGTMVFHTDTRTFTRLRVPTIRRTFPRRARLTVRQPRRARTRSSRGSPAGTSSRSSDDDPPPPGLLRLTRGTWRYQRADGSLGEFEATP